MRNRAAIKSKRVLRDGAMVMYGGTKSLRVWEERAENFWAYILFGQRGEVQVTNDEMSRLTVRLLWKSELNKPC